MLFDESDSKVCWEPFVEWMTRFVRSTAESSALIRLRVFRLSWVSISNVLKVCCKPVYGLNCVNSSHVKLPSPQVSCLLSVTSHIAHCSIIFLQAFCSSQVPYFWVEAVPILMKKPDLFFTSVSVSCLLLFVIKNPILISFMSTWHKFKLLERREP